MSLPLAALLALGTTTTPAHAGPRPPAGDVDDATQLEGPTPGPAASATEEVLATPTQAALVQALSTREPRPTCAALAALTPTPAPDLLWVVDHVTAPPWAAMGAAECLVTAHTAEARPTLERWLTDPRLKGLGWLVLKHLDELPLDDATALARLSLERGPDPEGARRRIARAKSPEIKALAAE